MALSPLATVADLAARGVTVTPEEEPIVTTHLGVASAALRDAAGSPISEATDTVVLEGEPALRLRLPGLPVTAVSEVRLNGVPVTDWLLRSGTLVRDAGWQSGGSSEVTVTYTHGLPTVPADIVDVVCRLTASALLAYRDSPNGGDLAKRPTIQERIGDYSVTYSYSPLLSEVELPEYMRKRLAARFGGGAGLVRSR